MGGKHLFFRSFFFCIHVYPGHFQLKLLSVWIGTGELLLVRRDNAELHEQMV